MSEIIRIDQDDLFTPKVEAFLEEQEVLRRAAPEIAEQGLLAKILFASWFYLGLAGGLGVFLGWALIEPYFSDNEIDDGKSLGFLIFACVGGGLGLFLGAAEGLMCRNPLRALTSASVGLGIGSVGGLVTNIPANILFVVIILFVVSFSPELQRGEEPVGLAFLFVVMGRATAWAMVAIPAGISQGIALRERKVALNGLIGAVLGGWLGGMMFDPLAKIFPPGVDGEAWISRLVGCTIIGVSVGVFVGLVEMWTKTAWLMMRAGPLAGKQFVIYRNPTVLGSSPKADIYLFKDAAIEPQHALIYNMGGRYEIQDNRTEDGTFVNGAPIKTHLLQKGDQIMLGNTVLEFTLKDKS